MDATAEELATLPHFWLSFADSKGFRGVAIVPGDSLITAVMCSHSLRVNPGGQVVGVPIDRDRFIRIPERYRHRLLTRAECETLNREMMS